MKVTRGLPVAPPPRAPVLTIGNFDGQHLGHRALVEAVVKQAQDLDGSPMVLSFDPHPIEVLRPGSAPKFLSEKHEKEQFFQELGVDELILLPFTPELAGLSPQEFVEQVLERGLGVRRLLVGENFVFGKGRSGSVQDLIQLGKQANFDVNPFPPKLVNGEVVSSTRIRECLVSGKIAEAADCLGRPYKLSGTVIPGEKRGEAMGWPTANLRLPSHRVHPVDGVYAVLLEIGQDEFFPAIAYIGKRPTFYGEERLLEVHVFDQTLSLYGKPVATHFIQYIRGDLTFSNAEELMDQMDQDGLEARKHLRESSWCGSQSVPVNLKDG